jgi:hypothetical protein
MRTTQMKKLLAVLIAGMWLFLGLGPTATAQTAAQKERTSYVKTVVVSTRPSDCNEDGDTSVFANAVGAGARAVAREGSVDTERGILYRLEVLG